MPLPLDIVGEIVTHLKHDTAELKNIRLADRTLGSNEDVKRHLFFSVRYNGTTYRRGRVTSTKSKGALLDIAPFVHQLLVVGPTTHDFTFQDLSRFSNLRSLMVIQEFWETPIDFVLPQTLTTLQISSNASRKKTLPTARLLLDFIISFPNLTNLLLSNIRFVASNVAGDVSDIIEKPGPTLRGLRIIPDSNSNAESKQFYSSLAKAVVEPEELRDLYLGDYNQGLELFVRGAFNLRSLQLVLTEVDINTFPAMPLAAQAESLSIGVVIWNWQDNEEDEDPMTVDWYAACLAMKVDNPRLKHLEFRVNTGQCDDSWGASFPRIKHLDQVIDTQLKAGTFKLETFRHTISFEDYEDNPTRIHRVEMLQEAVVKSFRHMCKRTIVDKRARVVQSDPVEHEPMMANLPTPLLVHKGWYMVADFLLTK